MGSIDGFRLSAGDFTRVGRDLARPECVLALRDGTLWVSDQRSALMRIDADGTQRRVGSIGGAPNGFALDAAGRFWIADIDGCRIVRLQADGRHEVVLDRFDGAPLGSANFVLADAAGRLWITVSTRTQPRSRAIHEDIADGYVLRLDPPYEQPVLAAGGFRFTNEVRLDADGRYLYVAETAIGGVTRLPVAGDGTLGAAERFGPVPLFAGAKIDGITFDADGNLWITEITRNALYVLDRDGGAHEVYADPGGEVLVMPTSLSFFGPDLRMAAVGSLKSDYLAVFRAPAAGLALSHWNARTVR